MKQISIQNSTINLSKDTFGYQEVLDDFQNTSQVNIVTFNISKNENNLIEKLEELDEDVVVNVVTNIPNRFETYIVPRYKQYKTPAQRALESIEYYCDTLDSANFSCDVSLFFNFNNHSKIIATNNIAYIGSANFSDESKSNIEAGIIIKNPADVEKINDILIPEIIRNSIRYSTSYYNIVNEFMKEKLDELKVIVKNVDEGLFTWIEVGYGSDEKVLDIHQGNISREEWNNFADLWGSVDDLISDVVSDFEDEVDVTSIQKCLFLLNEKVKFIEDTLWEIASFNLDVSDVAQESHLYHTGDPEDLEEALQYAQEKVNEKREDILRGIADRAESIDDALNEIPQIMTKLSSELDGIEEKLSEMIIYENARKINNTGENSNKI